LTLRPTSRVRTTRLSPMEMDHPILDKPEVLHLIFHPRPEYASSTASPGVETISIEVESGVSIGGRLWAAGSSAPLILFWHGNGEIAADYDSIAPLYTRMGISLLVIDYRGYGRSTGHPTGSSLLSDALSLLRSTDVIFDQHDLTPSRLYAVGRSLGSAAAIEAASQAGEELSGLIVESGFADTFALLRRLGLGVEGITESRDGFGNASKMALVTIPTLVIHGADDVLIPAQDGEELFQCCGAKEKRLLILPGAGHNDLMLVGQMRYFQAIQAFVFSKQGG
jgi:alpha-beta hydrolase superfamily lysophospholipase